MANDVVKLVQSVVAEKSALADREKQLIDNLNRVLPAMGYRVMRVEQSRRKRGRASRPTPEAEKTLVCQHCSRRFAHPLHLGRHMAAMHRSKKTLKKRRRKAA
jgi:hypothetical protein